MCDCNCETPKSNEDRIEQCKLEIDQLIAEDQGNYKKFIRMVRVCPDDEPNLRLEYLNSRSALAHDIDIYKAELESLTQKGNK